MSQHGGSQIEPEHLLIGLLAAHPEAVLKLPSPTAIVDEMRQRMVAAIAGGTRLPESHEVRFSRESVDALERAQIEAADMSNDTIRPEHLLLGILVETNGEATAALRDAGVHVSVIREALSSRGE